jgi:hypothetical protein
MEQPKIKFEDLTFTEVMNLVQNTLIQYEQGDRSDDVMEILDVFRNAYIAIPNPMVLLNIIASKGRGRPNYKSIIRNINVNEFFNSDAEIIYMIKNNRVRVLNPSDGYIWKDVNEFQLMVYDKILADLLVQFKLTHEYYGIVTNNNSFRIVGTNIQNDPRRREIPILCAILDNEMLYNILKYLGYQDNDLHEMPEDDLCDIIYLAMFNRGLIWYF